MSFDISVPTPTGPLTISLEVGSSAVFVGANGGGKTRLAVLLENQLRDTAHRISAHRALQLNPGIQKISERVALLGLRYGWADERAVRDHRRDHRWAGKENVALLNDYDFLVQALFAEQTNRSLATHKRVRAGDAATPEPAKLELLEQIWDRVLPHRKLLITGDDINVTVGNGANPYPASDMSDGERAIFYLVGQVLVARQNSVLIIDEPELHVHRAVMSKLWDELEAARKDCAFVFITHDLEFAAARSAQKFVIREYDPAPAWTLESVPEDTGFDEEIATLILGSRRPVLFVEGGDSSLDRAIYRCCFPMWTVIPRGSCEQVIHAVVSMRQNAQLTRVTCSGIVDADGYEPEDIRYLNELGIAVLSVSEIENLILLPAVSRVIARREGYQGQELENRLAALMTAVFDTLNSEAAIDAVVARYCRRRIDRILKKMDFSKASTVDDIAAEYERQTKALDIEAIATKARDTIKQALGAGDMALLLANYDNKALMSLAAQHLKQTRPKDFESWLTRILRDEKATDLRDAIAARLPALTAS
jgi:hypothetical protein